MQSVAHRRKYFYNYYEYFFAAWLQCCCSCCCKNVSCYKIRNEKLKRHKEATERLSNEIDIVTLLNVQRLTLFIAKLFLKRH